MKFLMTIFAIVSLWSCNQNTQAEVGSELLVNAHCKSFADNQKLLDAIDANDLDSVRQELASCANPSGILTADDSSLALIPLLHAFKTKDTNMVILLLENGADANQKTKIYPDLAEPSLQFEDSLFLSILERYGVDMLEIEGWKKGDLIFQNNPTTVLFFLKRGAKEPENFSYQEFFLLFYPNAEAMGYLLEQGYDFCPAEVPYPWLSAAVSKGNDPERNAEILKAYRTILEFGVDPCCYNQDNYSAIDICTIDGWQECVALWREFAPRGCVAE